MSTSQLATRSPTTRANSMVLRVMRGRSCARAVAAMSRSFGPIGTDHATVLRATIVERPGCYGLEEPLKQEEVVVDTLAVPGAEVELGLDDRAQPDLCWRRAAQAPRQVR